jgi:alpha-mannosidase
MTDGEPDGELLGPLEFEYLLYPFIGTFDAGRASRLVAEAQTGVYTHASRTLAKEWSFLEITPGSAVVTAIKPAAVGDGAIVRLWNPTDQPLAETIRPKCHLASAHLCNLNEDLGSALVIKDGAIPLTVPPRGLASVRFTWTEE